MPIHIDIETYSDLDLKKVGAYKYSLHPSTEILCISWCVDHGPVHSWRTWESEIAPTELRYLLNHGTDFVAWNASFERWVLGHKLMHRLLDTTMWRCAAIKSKYHGLPLGLDDACVVGRTGHQKDDVGHRIMLKLSKPRTMSKHCPETRWSHLQPPDGITKSKRKSVYANRVPEQYERLASYCDADVEAERELWYKSGDLPDNEWDLYWLDQQINDRGVLVDMYTVRRIIRAANRHKQRLIEQGEMLYGFSPSKVAKVTAYLGTADCQAQTIEDFILVEKDEDKKRLALLRQDYSKASVKKYDALRNFAANDDRVHGILQFYGALPGRWAGRGPQLHNLPRACFEDHDQAIEDILTLEYKDVEMLHGVTYMEALSRVVRPMLVAKDDHVFEVADFASIEAVVLPWLSKDKRAQHIINDYAIGKDLYVGQAKLMNVVRFIGKVAVLALGYGGAAGAFIGMAKNYGVFVEEGDANMYTKKWRKANPWAQSFWDNLWEAALAAVNNPGKAYFAGRIKYGYDGTSLRCMLPSGRILYYRNIKKCKAKFGGVGLKYEKYAGVYKELWYGTLAENVTQATARDILAHAMQTLRSHGYDIVLHVHDEVVNEVLKRNANIERVCELLCQLPSWATDLPMRAEGFVTRRYRKG